MFLVSLSWFQGENTVFRNTNSTAVSLSQQEKDEVDAKVVQYQQNLLDFVKDTRQEVYDVDPSRYSSPDVIPFAIIQLGCWIREYNDNGLTVFTAQQEVADNDPNIVLVLSSGRSFAANNRTPLGSRNANSSEESKEKLVSLHLRI